MGPPLRASTSISSPHPPPPLRQPHYVKPGGKLLTSSSVILSPVRAHHSCYRSDAIPRRQKPYSQGLTLTAKRGRIFLSQRQLCGTTRIAHGYHREPENCFPPTPKDWGDVYFPVFFFCKKKPISRSTTKFRFGPFLWETLSGISEKWASTFIAHTDRGII